MPQQQTFGQYVLGKLGRLGTLFSHAVGNHPDALRQKRELGLDSFSRERREEHALGISEDRTESIGSRARYRR